MAPEFSKNVRFGSHKNNKGLHPPRQGTKTIHNPARTTTRGTVKVLYQQYNHRLHTGTDTTDTRILKVNCYQYIDSSQQSIHNTDYALFANQYIVLDLITRRRQPARPQLDQLAILQFNTDIHALDAPAVVINRARFIVQKFATCFFHRKKFTTKKMLTQQTFYKKNKKNRLPPMQTRRKPRFLPICPDAKFNAGQSQTRRIPSFLPLFLFFTPILIEKDINI